MKEQVRCALIAYCENYPTRNRAAESLQNVSAATVSQLCNGKYELISDDMFTRIAVQIGLRSIPGRCTRERPSRKSLMR